MIYHVYGIATRERLFGAFHTLFLCHTKFIYCHNCHNLRIFGDRWPNNMAWHTHSWPEATMRRVRTGRKAMQIVCHKIDGENVIKFTKECPKNHTYGPLTFRLPLTEWKIILCQEWATNPLVFHAIYTIWPTTTQKHTQASSSNLSQK